MKKTTKTVELMGTKVRNSILAKVDAEAKAFQSQQAKMLAVMDDIDKAFGTPEKATGYVHTVHKAMVEGGRDVPAKYSEAIADSGECGKWLKRFYDFIRNNGDAAESKAFNMESYLKAIAKKCADHPEMVPALVKLAKELAKAPAPAA